MLHWKILVKFLFNFHYFITFEYQILISSLSYLLFLGNNSELAVSQTEDDSSSSTQDDQTSAANAMMKGSIGISCAIGMLTLGLL